MAQIPSTLSPCADLPTALLLTGTGKTVYVKDVLESLDKGRYSTIQTAFSARTSANQTQVSSTHQTAATD